MHVHQKLIVHGFHVWLCIVVVERVYFMMLNFPSSVEALIFSGLVSHPELLLIQQSLPLAQLGGVSVAQTISRDRDQQLRAVSSIELDTFRLTQTIKEVL